VPAALLLVLALVGAAEAPGVPAPAAAPPGPGQGSPGTPPPGPGAAGGPGEVVEEVVAVVRPPGGEARIITLTKLVEEGRIALVARGGLEAAFRPLDAETLRASLEWTIDQLLLLDEATRLKVFEVDRADALASLARFKEVFPRPEDYRAFLHDLDVTEEELLSTLRRTLRVRRYLESRLGRLRATDAEAESWYRRHPGAFGGQPFAAVKDTARARAVDERVDAETRALLRELRSRSDIRVLAAGRLGGS
jgi:hypothetical protein